MVRNSNGNHMAIIDDEPWARKGIQDIIPWADYGFCQIDSYATAEDALEALRKEDGSVDAVITDIRLPGLNGLEFAGKALEEGLATVVVIVSAYREFDYARQAIAEGVLYYLLKPLDCDEVRNVARMMQEEIGKRKGREIQPAQITDRARWKHCYIALRSVCPREGDCQAIPLEVERYPEAGAFSCEYPLTGTEMAPGISREWENFESLEEMITEAKNSQAYGFAYSTHPLTGKLQAYLAAHWNERLRNAEIAKLFFISEAYMIECFKRYAGKSMGSFLIDIRLKEAARLLCESDESIFNISQRVGYNDAGYFGRLFRKKMGMSPEHYRRSHI